LERQQQLEYALYRQEKSDQRDNRQQHRKSSSPVFFTFRWTSDIGILSASC
jgi:hypothetical protein